MWAISLGRPFTSVTKLGCTGILKALRKCRITLSRILKRVLECWRNTQEPSIFVNLIPILLPLIMVAKLVEQ